MPTATVWTEQDRPVGGYNGAPPNIISPLQIIAGTAAEVPLLIKGAAGQTGNLFEARNNVDTILAKINPDGTLIVGPAASGGSGGSDLFGSGTATATGLQAFIQSQATNVMPLRLRGQVGQVSPLQDWQVNTTTKAALLADGSLSLFDTGITDGSKLFVQSKDASSPVASLRGFASQTADVLGIQNSSGTLLSRITNDGSFWTSGTISAGNSNYGNASFFSKALNASIPAAILRGFASQSVNILEIQNSGGTPLSFINQNGAVRANAGLSIGGNDAGTGVGLLVQPGAAGNVLALIKAAASQTADLTQWQNSAGAILAKVGSDGSIRSEAYLTAPILTDTAGTGAFFSFDGSSIYAIARKVGSPSVVIKGAASQTADLTQWQNSAGTTLIGITRDGDIASGGGAWFSTGGYLGSRLGVKSALTSEVGIIVRGQPSQTADLQQWQDSGGGQLAAMDSAGGFFGRNIYAGQRLALGGALNVMAKSNAEASAVIRQIASQTSDLLNVQDSAGSTNLVRIDSAGNFYTKGVLGVGDAGYLGGALSVQQRGNYEASAVIRGRAAQTFNLLETQNSAGTLLNAITPAGELQFNNGVSGLFNIVGYYDTAALGAYYGRAQVRCGATVKYLPLYN